MSSVETVNALERRINASIPQQVIRSSIAARLKKIGRTAKISGFRPGKIPAKILEQYYGAQAQQEALSEAVQLSFAETVQQNKLMIAGNPRFEVKASSVDSDAIEYSAIFEIYPEVVIGDLSEQDFEHMVCELTQTDVDDSIMTLRKQRTKYEAVDRAAQSGDQVCIDFIGKLNGKNFIGGEACDYKFVIGAGVMLPAFESSVSGMKADETRSFDMTFTDDYHNKDVAGKQATFTVTLKLVEAPKLPEIDAGFADSIGVEGGDVSKMEGEVRTNLEREMVRRLKVRNKKTAMDLLLSVAQFDVPKTLVMQEASNLMQQSKKDMKSQGVEDAELSPMPFIERAEKRVKLGLIIADLAQKHDLKAKPEQVRALVEDYAQSFDKPEDVVSWVYSNSSQLHEIENLVLEENIVRWIMGLAKTTDRATTFKELMGN